MSRCFLLLHRRNATTINATAANAPTTPPAMAPAGGGLDGEEDEGEEDVGPGGDNEDEALAEYGPYMA